LAIGPVADRFKRLDQIWEMLNCDGAYFIPQPPQNAGLSTEILRGQRWDASCKPFPDFRFRQRGRRKGYFYKGLGGEYGKIWCGYLA